MKTLQNIKKEILDTLAVVATAKDEPQGLSKSADQVLADAIQHYLSTTADKVPSPPATHKSGKRIKEKGLALTHMELQGGAANQRNTPLLMKSKHGVSLNVNKAVLDNADPEILAALVKLGYVLGVE